MLDNNRIKVETEATFFGVVFDRTSSYNYHVSYLKAVSHTDWEADRKTPLCIYRSLIRSQLDYLCLYRSLIRSKLDYVCILRGAALKSILKKLDPVPHQGLRIAQELFVLLL